MSYINEKGNKSGWIYAIYYSLYYSDAAIWALPCADSAAEEKITGSLDITGFRGILYKSIGTKSGVKRGQGMQNLENTQYFKVGSEPDSGVKTVLSSVYEALTEKGYNPVNQIVGYIMSGDPTYVTSHKNARSMIMKVERDELVEELLTEYIRTKGWQKEE